jgi:hypothetical protein
MKINVEHELMKNYVYAEPHQISNKMQACQAADGHALLFTISDDGYFQVWQEKHGNSVGWWALNLTSGGMGNCVDFNVSQNFQTGYIDIVIIMSLNAQISLYVSLQNPINPMIDVAWSTLSTYWENLNFGIPNTDMRNAYITYENNGSTLVNRYLVIDTAKNSQYIKRYFIQLLGLGVSNNPHQPPPGPEVWQVQNDGFFKTTSKSALGRRSLTENYGIYTLQPVGNNFNSLYFTQVYDRNNTSIPQIPQQMLTLGSPTSFALASKPDGSTYLFIACDNDSDGHGGNSISVFAPGLTSIDNTQLFADSTDTETILWGLNGLTQIFRVKCPKGQELNPAAWSVPVPIIQGATNITAYLNRVTGHSTIFAQTIDRGLIKLKQDPATKIWQQRNILKPIVAVKQVHEIDTFTTHIQCTDDNGLPINLKWVDNPGSPVESHNQIFLKIKTDSQASFYVNNQYTIISPGDEPAFPVDETGVLTIVQETHSLSAVQFTITEPMSGTSVKVNPMGKIMDKISGINTWDDLAGIQVFDERGNGSNLVSGTPSDPDKEEFKQAFKNLKGAWTKIKSGNNAVRSNAPATWGLSFNATGWDYHEGAATVNLMNTKLKANIAAVIDSTNAIEVIAEDLFKWMKTAYDDVAHYVFEEITEGFRFLLTIGEKVYKIIIKEVNSLIQAVELLFNKVKIAFVKLKSWLGFVFDWGDIKRTHNVLKNLYDVYAHHAIDSVTTIEAKINTEFTNAINYVNTWKSLDALPSFTGDAFTSSANTISSQTSSRFTSMNSPQANMVLHHYKHNFLNMSGVSSRLELPANLLDDILNSFENQIDNFIQIKDQIQTQIIDNFNTLSLKDILQQLFTILKNSVANSITNILDTIRRIIIDVINAFKSYLTQVIQTLEDAIDIPVISWLYDKIIGEPLSYRGVLCLAWAFPTTIIYKGISQKTPFPANDSLTNSLLNVRNYTDLLALYNTRTTNRVARDGTDSPTVADFLTAIFGICAMGSSILITCNNVRGYWVELKGGVPIGDEIAKKVAKFNAFANIAFVSPNFPSVVPLNAVNIMNDVFTIVSIIKGFLPVAFNKKLTTPKATQVLNWFEFGLNFAWFAPVIVNVCTNKDNPSYKGLGPETIGDFGFNFGGMLTPFVPIALKKSPQAGGAVLVLQGIMTNGYGLMSTISGLEKARVF